MGYKKMVTLAGRCAKYAQACRKRSILETKPVGKIDASELGMIYETNFSNLLKYDA